MPLRTSDKVMLAIIILVIIYLTDSFIFYLRALPVTNTQTWCWVRTVNTGDKIYDEDVKDQDFQVRINKKEIEIYKKCDLYGI